MKGAICSGCGKPYEPRHNRDRRCLECYSRSGKKSKRKGYSDEARFAKYFQSQLELYGLPYTIRRTPSSGAIHEFDPADFYFRGLPLNSVFKRLHLEKKDRESWSLIEWLKEAEDKEADVGLMRRPVVIVRKPNDTDDYVFMRKELFTEIILQLERLMQESE